MACAVMACSQKQQVTPQGAIPGEKAKAGAKLAYEHNLRIELPSDQIAPRVLAVREACESARFGDCNVLNIEQDGASGGVVVRIVPTGVEPITALAAKEGKIASRSTRGEDLAEAMADNDQKLRQLEAYSAQLDQFSQRKDLAASDLIALGHERAALIVQRDDLQRTAAQQQRRLDTNLLTIRFYDPVTASGRGFSWGDWFDELKEGIQDALRMLAYGLPWLILALPLALLWRWVWRRVTRSARERKHPTQ
ncbi:DUF4349 domain-containing protein [Dyella terrae]|uniref:DUF4349 domain-containing protein n=3 Tax=Rhodanobacteraceae TaxID=1775411 RepID=A0A4R0YE34_9GAMM|nr:DUF4349 domain-containing protein [Dyella terrae]TCI06264.1 DUF4349 domain-containing protein [Dyella soli]